jgi:GT2 family glycosyltransferase
MPHPKGASAPFSFAPLVRSRRADALLAQAAEDFRQGNFADALVAAESVCRMLPTEAVPAVLRAEILAKCRPTLAPRAWVAAWARDPLKPLLQDAMLGQWMAAGAHRRAAEQGVQFLPHRCRDGTEKPLLDLLARAGVNRVGACWREGDEIVVRCFDLAGDGGPLRVVVASEFGDEVHEVPKDTGLRVKPAMTKKNVVVPALSRDPVALRGVYSLAFDHGPLLQGSPISFDSPAPLENPPPIEPGVDIIIPVYRDAAGVQACLRSVLDSLPRNRTRASVIVVNDASPEPQLVLWLQSLAAAGRIELLHNRYNLGFIETVNRGLRAGRRHALMLNADTLVHGDWLDRLAAALHDTPEIASVMPWSNNAEIGSLAPREKDAACSMTDLALIDTAAARLRAAGETSDMPLPTNIGFAMLMRRKVLDQIGLLDGEALTRGYNEEVDWCLRARAAGFRHILATGVFVAHKGSASFGAEKQLRVRQNRAVIAARYPRYYTEYFDYLRRDPLRDARRKLLEAVRASGSRWPGESATGQSRVDRNAALKTSWRRIPVWNLQPGSEQEARVLARARGMASAPKDSTRLLVFGNASEALWHTGVVDVIPPSKNPDEPLTDEVLASLAGCESP